MLRLILILLLGLVITGTSASVEVNFLRNVPRLNNNSYMDNYFLCNGVGQTLQWGVNGYELSGFQGGNVARVLFGSQFNNKFNFKYTANLLSSVATTGGLYTFDSVLIVSVQGNSYLNVTCSNGSTSNSITNSEEHFGITDQDRRSNDNVMFERVLTRVIVNGTSTITPTSIFICGVNNAFMSWETTSGNNYGFSIFDSAGSKRQNLVAGEITVQQQAIFLSAVPYMLVSVFCVTGDSDITVTCGYPQAYEHLTSNYFSLKTKSASTFEGDITASELEPEATSGGDTTTDELYLLKTQNSTTLAAIITVIAFVVCCLVIVVVVCLVYFIYRKKKISKEHGDDNCTYAGT